MKLHIASNREATICIVNNDLAKDNYPKMVPTGKAYFDGEAMWHEATCEGHEAGWFTLGHPERRAPGEHAVAAWDLNELLSQDH